MGDEKSKVRRLFESMNYENGVEPNLQLTWLTGDILFLLNDNTDKSSNGHRNSLQDIRDRSVCEVYTPDDTTIETILNKYEDKTNSWFKIAPTERAEILYKLGVETEKERGLFLQIETHIRGICSKDTKQQLSLLTDCIKFYSSFCVEQNCDNELWEPRGWVVGILSNENSISALGYILGPALAAGYKIILQVHSQLSLVSAALIVMATRVGVPANTIKLIPGDVNPNIFLRNVNVSVAVIFDDLYKKQYQTEAHSYLTGPNVCKLLHFYSSGIPMLVFDDCDLDSACRAVVSAAWGHKGMLPWSVRRILVQESIYDRFCRKLQQIISEIKVGAGDAKNIDVSLPDRYVLEKLKTLVDNALNNGAEAYALDPDSAFPRVIIDGYTFPKNVIGEDGVNAPLVTLSAFRSLNEAAQLANNTRDGLAASVWTESLSLAHEIADKLKVGNVWLNSHGLFAANVPISPYKSSGCGYFGGARGFYEYISVNSSVTSLIADDKIEMSVGEAKKGQVVWCKLGRSDRIKYMQEIAFKIAKNKDTWNISEKWLSEWVKIIHSYLVTDFQEAAFKTKSFYVSVVREPVGIAVIENGRNYETHNRKVIIAALVEGNSVVLLNGCEETTEFYSFMSKYLPKGILSVIKIADNIEHVLSHREVGVYIATGLCSTPSHISMRSKYKQIAYLCDCNEARNLVTQCKNVWFNKTQTFM